MVYDPAGNHKTRVESATCDSSQRVPCSVVKPVPKIVEPMLYKIFCRSEIKPRIEFVDDAFKSDDAEESTSDSSARDGAKNDKAKQATGIAACGCFQERLQLSGRHPSREEQREEFTSRISSQIYVTCGSKIKVAGTLGIYGTLSRAY